MSYWDFKLSGVRSLKQQPFFEDTGTEVKCTLNQLNLCNAKRTKITGLLQNKLNVLDCNTLSFFYLSHTDRCYQGKKYFEKDLNGMNHCFKSVKGSSYRGFKSYCIRVKL